MSDAKKNEEARQGRSAAAIAALDASEQSSTPAEPAETPKAAPKEKISTGRDDSQINFDRLSKGLRAKRDKAKRDGDNALVARLNARLKALRETIQ